MAKAPINVTITGDYNDRDIKRAIRDLRSLQGDAGQTSQAMGMTGKAGIALGAAVAAGAATAGYAIVRFGKDSIMAASDFEEVQNKVQEVFGPAGRQVLNDFAETADTAMGLSRTAFLDASSQFGIFGRAAGLAGRDLVTFSSDLTQLSGDLASFNNTTVDEAIQALGAGLRGESEPLRRFGILLDDATLKARAMELGIYDGTGSLTQQQRVLAAQAEILAQTNVQQGDFARTADGLANTMRTLSAAVENAQIEIGKGFVAAIQQVSSDMGGPSGLAARIEDVGRQISNMTRGIGFLVGKFRELTDESEGTYNPLQSLVRIFQAIDAASPVQGIVRLAGQIGILGDATRDYIAEGSAMEAALRAQSALLRARSRDQQANLDGLSAATDRYTGLAQSLGAEIGFGTLGLQRYNVYLEELKERTKASGSATKEATEAQKKFEDRLKEGRETLQKAIESAKEYAENIRTSFVDALDLGAALDAAKETGKSIVEEFIKQGERMAKFSENVRKLVAAGLERPAFDAIIRAGSQRGADIAAALVDGNVAENARRVNDVYRSVNNMGIEVGRQAAPVFESAGILTAQSMLERMIREFMPAGRKRRQLLASIDEMVGEALRNLGRMTGFSVSGGAPSGGGVSGGGGVEFVGNEVRFPTAGLNNAQVSDMIDGILMGGGIPVPFAKGGIVTAPTLGLVGEAGPEAIIPLRRAGGVGTTINLTVNAGMGTDGAEVGRQIVDALRQYQRRNGPVPISVA